MRRAQELLQEGKQKVGEGAVGGVPLASCLPNLPAAQLCCCLLSLQLQLGVHVTPCSWPLLQVVAQGVSANAVVTDMLVAVANSAADTGEACLSCAFAWLRIVFELRLCMARIVYAPWLRLHGCPFARLHGVWAAPLHRCMVFGLSLLLGCMPAFRADAVHWQVARLVGAPVAHAWSAGLAAVAPAWLCQPLHLSTGREITSHANLRAACLLGGC